MQALKSLALLVLCAVASIAAPYQVVIDTSSLVGDFQIFMTLSGATGNTVTASGFTFGGGAAIPPPLVGTGDLNSTVTLQIPNPGGFFDLFAQNFTPGSSLSFLLDLTNTAPAVGNAPDQFTFALATPVGSNLPTTDPSGSDNLFSVDLTGAPLSFNIYSTLAEGITAQISPASPIPEPSFGIATAGLFAVFAGIRRFRKAA
jgi:hypothetical protein